jgi:AraC-like DNA-binding protein
VWKLCNDALAVGHEDRKIKVADLCLSAWGEPEMDFTEAAEDHLKLRFVTLEKRGSRTRQQGEVGFVFVKHGSGVYVAGKISHPLLAGDVLVSSVPKPATITASDPGGFSFFSFRLNLEHLFPLFAAEEVALLDLVAAGLTGPKVIPADSPLAKRCQALVHKVPAEHTLNHRTQLLSLATLILAEEFDTARRQRGDASPAENPSSHAVRHLSAEHLLNCSIDELATAVHCSRRQLSRLFRQHFGYSVAALRLEVRMMKAVTLLRNPDAKVINVAEQCGFHHVGLFNTCFKKRFAITPTRWRQQSSRDREARLRRGPLGRLCPLQFIHAGPGIALPAEKQSSPMSPS